MNYEFHVGDYVETVDKEIGYISDICDCDRCKERGWLEPHIVFSDGEEDYISNYDVKCLSNRFVRIGAYDFTKKENKKIEHLEENLPIEGRLKDKTIKFKQYLDDGYATFIYNGKMIDKINELVDVVNKLRNDYDEHIEAHRQTER